MKVSDKEVIGLRALPTTLTFHCHIFAYQVQLLNCGGLRLLAYVGKAFRKKHAAGLKQWLDSSL